MPRTRHFSSRYRFKSLGETGLTDLNAVALLLEAEAQIFREMAQAGVRLDQPTEDGYAHLSTADPAVAKRFLLDHD